MFILLGVGSAQFLDDASRTVLGLNMILVGMCVLTAVLFVSADRFDDASQPSVDDVSETEEDHGSSAEETPVVAVSPGRAKLMTMEIRLIEEKKDERQA